MSRLFIPYHAHHHWGTWLLVEEKRNMMWNHYHNCSFFILGEKQSTDGGVMSRRWSSLEDLSITVFPCFRLGGEVWVQTIFLTLFSIVLREWNTGCDNIHHFLLCLGNSHVSGCCSIGSLRIPWAFFPWNYPLLNTIVGNIVAVSVCYLISLLFF